MKVSALALCASFAFGAAGCSSSPAASQGPPPDVEIEAGPPAASATTSPGGDGGPPAGFVACQWDTTPLDTCLWQ